MSKPNVGELRKKKDVGGLIAALIDKDWMVRWGAAEALGKLGNPIAVEPLITTLRDEDWNVRWYAAIALGEIGDKRAVAPLTGMIRDKDSWVRKRVAEALGKIGDPRSVPALEKAIGDSDWGVRDKAKEALGKIKQSKKLANKAKNVANERKSGYDLAFKSISDAEVILAETRTMGVITPCEPLMEAKQAFDDGNYEEVIEHAKQFQEAAKRIQEESKPEIILKLLEETFKPNEWKRIEIAITNTGSMHAKEIKIEPSGDIEFRRIPTVPQLNTNETETITIGMKPTVMGDVPIDIVFAYKDALNREYTSSDEVWMLVTDRTPPSEQNFTTLRTVWDPLKKDFLWNAGKPEEFGELIGVKRWIKNNNPNIYWFLLKIVNRTDHAITGWNVTLSAEQALTITEAHIDEKPVRIVKADFDRKSGKNMFTASVPSELGVSIPERGGTRRMYFKMDIRCEGALMGEFGVSGVVRLVKPLQAAEVPIREKRFTYACKFGDFKGLWDESIEELVSLVRKSLQNSYDQQVLSAITNSIRLLRDFEQYCNERYAEPETIVEKLELVYHSLAAAEPITGDAILPLVEENLNAMRRLVDVEAQKERGKRMCGQLVELLHIATTGSG